MGRPLNKRFLGDPATPDQRVVGSETENNFRVECNTGNGAVDTGYIIAQKGTNKFKVTDGTTTLDCRLVDKATAALATGEMVMFGSDGTGNRITLRKVTGHKAYDFSDNVYTWSIEDDSTESIVILTAI